MDKAAERSTLILQLGGLLAPIINLVEKPTPPTSAEYRVAAARFQHDFGRWKNEVSRFVVVQNVQFQNEYSDIMISAWPIFTEVSTLAKDSATDEKTKQAKLRVRLEVCQKETIAAIGQVPIDWASKLLKGNTPFSTYLKIRDAISTAKKRVHYFDRYLDADFFPLYLRDLDRSLEIRLVTTRGNERYGVTNMRVVSRLVAQEFTNYQLIESNAAEIHDRNLRVDDTVFHLGSSAKDAGKHPMNFTLADSTAQAHQILDDLIAKGTVVI